MKTECIFHIKCHGFIYQLLRKKVLRPNCSKVYIQLCLQLIILPVNSLWYHCFIKNEVKIAFNNSFKSILQFVACRNGQAQIASSKALLFHMSLFQQLISRISLLLCAPVTVVERPPPTCHHGGPPGQQSYPIERTFLVRSTWLNDMERLWQAHGSWTGNSTPDLRHQTWKGPMYYNLLG